MFDDGRAGRGAPAAGWEKYGCVPAMRLTLPACFPI
jgi:hypothetical protein